MKVELQFFEDDATGGYGLAHRNSIDEGFNAFFNPIGIFHDIMEHYFEDIHPNFSGKYAFNYGGEIAASGHAAWYIHGLGLSARWTDIKAPNNIEDAFARGVGLEDELCYGNTRFGDELLCKPRNIYTLHPNYSMFVTYHWYYWNKMLEETTPRGCSQNVQIANRLRKSLSLRKLEALYGWGYYTAKKLVPPTDENRQAIEDLYEDIKRFTQHNDPYYLVNRFKYFTAYITPGNKLKYRFTVSDGINEFNALDSDSWETHELF